MPQRLPGTYRDAEIRAVLPRCPQRERLGLAIDFPGQPTLRVAVSDEGARLLMLALADYSRSRAGSQSPGSADMPSAPMSVPSDGVNT